MTLITHTQQKLQLSICFILLALFHKGCCSWLNKEPISTLPDGIDHVGEARLTCFQCFLSATDKTLSVFTQNNLIYHVVDNRKVQPIRSPSACNIQQGAGSVIAVLERLYEPFQATSMSKVAACQEDNLFLQCRNRYNKLLIKDVFYGRDNDFTCKSKIADSTTKCQNLTPQSVKDKVQLMCNNELKCKVPVSPEFLEKEGDWICPSVRKYLRVQYICHQEPRLLMVCQNGCPNSCWPACKKSCCHPPLPPASPLSAPASIQTCAAGCPSSCAPMCSSSCCESQAVAASLPSIPTLCPGSCPSDCAPLCTTGCCKARKTTNPILRFNQPPPTIQYNRHQEMTCSSMCSPSNCLPSCSPTCCLPPTMQMAPTTQMQSCPTGCPNKCAPACSQSCCDIMTQPLPVPLFPFLPSALPQETQTMSCPGICSPHCAPLCSPTCCQSAQMAQSKSQCGPMCANQCAPLCTPTCCSQEVNNLRLAAAITPMLPAPITPMLPAQPVMQQIAQYPVYQAPPPPPSMPQPMQMLPPMPQQMPLSQQMSMLQPMPLSQQMSMQMPMFPLLPQQKGCPVNCLTACLPKCPNRCCITNVSLTPRELQQRKTYQQMLQRFRAKQMKVYYG